MRPKLDPLTLAFSLHDDVLCSWMEEWATNHGLKTLLHNLCSWKLFPWTFKNVSWQRGLLRKFDACHSSFRYTQLDCWMNILFNSIPKRWWAVFLILQNVESTIIILQAAEVYLPWAQLGMCPRCLWRRGASTCVPITSIIGKLLEYTCPLSQGWENSARAEAAQAAGASEAARVLPAWGLPATARGKSRVPLTKCHDATALQHHPKCVPSQMSWHCGIMMWHAWGFFLYQYRDGKAGILPVKRGTTWHASSGAGRFRANPAHEEHKQWPSPACLTRWGTGCCAWRYSIAMCLTALLCRLKPAEYSKCSTSTTGEGLGLDRDCSRLVIVVEFQKERKKVMPSSFL